MTFSDVLTRRPGGSWHGHDASDIEGEATFLSLRVNRLLAGTINGKEIIVSGGAAGILRSDNYSAGVDGWQILGDGSAEFNAIVVRGTIEAGAGSDVDWSYISSVAINDADVVDLSADKITAGSISTDVIYAMPSGTGFPGGPIDGELFHRTDQNITYRYDTGGAAWLPLDQIQSGARIDNAIIGNAHITDLSADKIDAGTLAVARIGANALGMDKIELTAALAASQVIRSTTYTPGSAGWSIEADGSAEFQNVIIRGTLNADDLTLGTLDVDRIAANTLFTEKLIIGSFDNLISNPGWEAGTGIGAYDGDGIPLGGGPHLLRAFDGTEADSTPTIVSTARSGGNAFRWDRDSQTQHEFIEFNGFSGDIEKHVAAAEGDEFYFEAWIRYIDNDVASDPKLVIDYRDEAGAFIADDSATATGLTTSYQKFSMVSDAGGAPAGTAYVVFKIQLVYNAADSGNEAVLVDDAHARRRINTEGIEDQAVDIDRMLDPVWQDGTDNGSNNDSINATESDIITDTLTVPTWVGEANVLMTTRLHMANMNSQSVTSPMFLYSRIGGTTTSDDTEGFDNSENTAHQVVVPAFRSITSPGSSITLALRAKTQSGTSTTNETDIVAIATGIR